MKVSIITATFNSAATIGHTLDSILQQSYLNYEVLVVDGLSTDTTLSIVEHYAPQFGGRLRWISEADNGLYDAMNKGIAMATGDVVGILNSDDFYSSPQVLAQLVEALETTGVDAVYGDVRYVSPTQLHKTQRYYSSAAFRPWQMRLGFIPAHPTFYCRRAVLLSDALFNPSYPIAADFELLLRLIFIRKIRTHYLPLECVTMRSGGVSSSGWRSHRQALCDHRRALRSNGVYSNIFFLLLRYAYKYGELLCYRLRSRFRSC